MPTYLWSLSPVWLEVSVDIHFGTHECVCAYRFGAQQKIQARERNIKLHSCLLVCRPHPRFWCTGSVAQYLRPGLPMGSKAQTKQAVVKGCTQLGNSQLWTWQQEQPSSVFVGRHKFNFAQLAAESWAALPGLQIEGRHVPAGAKKHCNGAVPIHTDFITIFEVNLIHRQK